jgi:uncharacterized protein RhaS with RHS repeats
MYMQARYYDPVIGRFYSNDPVGFRDIHSFNRYAYANNNPYKYIDPDGRSSINARGLSQNISDFNKTRVANGVSNAQALGDITGATDVIDAVKSVMSGDLGGAAVSMVAAVVKPAKGLKVLSKKQLKNKGIDAEAFKESEVGSKQGAKFNMAADKDGNVSLTSVKKGAGDPIPTNQKIDDIAEDFPLEKKN